MDIQFVLYEAAQANSPLQIPKKRKTVAFRQLDQRATLEDPTHLLARRIVLKPASKLAALSTPHHYLAHSFPE
jgi:hypothetical protein